ncbi:MAG: PilZ domain-containing protein [Alphaproteobacteria bacterium]
MRTQSDERRTFERTPVSWPGTLIGDEVSDDCTVFDFSQGGASVTSSNVMPMNRKITLKIPRVGVFVGQVTWRNADRMGLNFNPLDDRPTQGVEKDSLGTGLIGLDPYVQTDEVAN